jgi:hypothetical protein
MAMKGIPQGTPDYIRAQDIAMVSCAALTTDKNGNDKTIKKDWATRCNR